MRIACIYLPSFPLQVHIRHAPHLAGTSLAVADASDKPTIAACSRRAWEQGVRPGMSVMQARAIAPEVTIVPGQPELYQRAALSLGESLLVHSVTVDIHSDAASVPQHRSIFLHVPTGSRGASFGAALLAHLDRQGLRGRVGIADDRFTAWVAAVVTPSESRKPEASQLDLGVSPQNPAFVQTTTTVPRGGAAAFLAPKPLELLPLPGEVRHMLHTLGIHTLGDFAALPPPSVGRRWNRDGIDYQALARGDDPTTLTGLVPHEAIVETIDCDTELSDLEPLSFLLRPLIDRTCERLRGRGMAAGEITLTLVGPAARTRVKAAPSRPTLSSQTLLDLLRAKLSEQTLEHPVASLHLEVTRESEPEVCELDLFDHRDTEVSADAIDIAIARLQSVLGTDSVNAAELVDTHRPERAFKLTPFSPPRRQKRTRRAKERPARTARPALRAGDRDMVLPLVLTGMVGALRLVNPPSPQPVDLRTIEHEGARHRVVASHGPTRMDGEWWSDDAMGRDYYEVETDDGGRYWVFKAKNDGRFYLHGIFD